MLYRAFLPELHLHFEEEEVSFDWLFSWFETLLAKELPLECVMRLWDTYLASPDGIELHSYICLSILAYLKDQLEG
jgi:hypothetical protein